MFTEWEIAFHKLSTLNVSFFLGFKNDSVVPVLLAAILWMSSHNALQNHEQTCVLRNCYSPFLSTIHGIRYRLPVSEPWLFSQVLLFFQVKICGDIKLEPLSASVVCSVASVTSHASVTTVTMTPSSSSNAGNDDSLCPGRMSAAIPYIPAQQQASSTTGSHQERALRYFCVTQSGDPGHIEPERISPPLLPKSQERVGAPPAATSFTGHRQQGEAVEELREEEDRGRKWGGAREESQGGSSKRSPDRDRDGRQQQHPQPQQSAEPSFWRGDSQQSRDRVDGGGRGKGGYLREAVAAQSSSTQEREKSGGWSQAGISGRRTQQWAEQKRDWEEEITFKREYKEGDECETKELCSLYSLSWTACTHAWFLSTNCTHTLSLAGGFD